MVVNATPTFHALLQQVVTGYSHGAKESLQLLNIGTKEAPKYIKINVNATKSIKLSVIVLFHEYQDIFAWNNEDLKGIPKSMAEPNATLV